MAAQLIPGKEIAEKVKAAAREGVRGLSEKGVAPKLAAVQVGENAASAVYVKAQQKNCAAMGIGYELKSLPAATGQADLAAFIESLNNDASVTGIILQMPLPAGVDVRAMQALIRPEKDVEGVNPANMGWIVYGRPALAPCTALAVLECFNHTGVDPRGKETVMVGHSDIVGKPAALLLLDRFATVSVCHIGTAERGLLESHVRRAEILIVAVGRAGVVKGDWVRDGAVVIDVGINRVGDSIVGDVEFDGAKERAAWITPVPGGVGSVTTAMLMRNVVESAKLLAR